MSVAWGAPAMPPEEGGGHQVIKTGKIQCLW